MDEKIVFKCRVCLHRFHPKSINQTFCSDVCRGVYYGKSPEAIRRNLEANKKAVAEWRRALKMKAVDYKGGHCVVCGYSKAFEALEFHHLDPSQKDFSISVTGNCRSWEKVKKELDKCALVCSNCHREIHAGVTVLACSINGNVSDC